MSSSDYRDTLHVSYSRDGVTGHGEGAPIPLQRKRGSRAKSARVHSPFPAVRRSVAILEAHARGLVAHNRQLRRESRPRHRADGLGRAETGHPAVPLLRVGPKDAPTTTFSIGIDTPEMTRKKIEEAAQFPVLKIKVGLDTGRSDHRCRSRRDQEAAPGGCERGMAGQGRSRPEDQLAREEWRSICGTADAGGHARGNALGAPAACTCLSSPTRLAGAPLTFRNFGTRTMASTLSSTNPAGSSKLIGCSRWQKYTG